MTRILLVCLLSVLLQSCASARLSQEIQLGKANFESGYYRDAFRELLPAASDGNPEAQYAVGYMYYYGYGVSQDMDTGMFWIKKAADQHLPKAVEALKAMQHPA